MKKIFFYVFVLLSFNSYSQSFSVKQNNVTLTGFSTDNDFSQNTYLDAFADDTLSWNIISDSLPSSWDFSNCFPNCYPTGATSGNLVTSNGQSYYLNCHIYPNNTSGEGFITMEITNSAGDTEQVTWYGIAGNVGLEENYVFNKKDIKIIFNLNGQIVKETETNQLYIIQLINNSFIKTFIVD